MQAQGPTVPRTFIAFAPYGVGVLCALFYFEKVRDLYGWWIGARDSEYHSAYFKLEEYFDLELETGACYFNDVAYPVGQYVSSGSELLHCEERGVWVRTGEMRPHQAKEAR